MDFPAEFLDRERALLGPRFAELYAYACLLYTSRCV